MEQPPMRIPARELRKVIRSYPPFMHFDELTLAGIEAETELVHLSKGAILFAQGDPGDGVYVLIRGRLRVTTTDLGGAEIVLAILEPGTCVGEMAMLTGQPRTATVCALDDAELLRLSKAGFDWLALRHPEAMAEIVRSAVPRWRDVQLVDALRTVFGTLEAVVLRDLRAALQWKHLSRGEVLFRQGQPGDAMYIVVNGRMRIEVEASDGGKQVVDEVGRGETVGVFALLTGNVRSATVYAIRDTDLVTLTRPVFERLLEQHPQVMIQLARMIVKRAQHSRGVGTVETPAISVALVPINPATSIEVFARKLSTALAAVEPTLHLSSTQIDRDYGKQRASQTEVGDPTEIGIVGWLTRMEQQHRYVIYEADRTLTRWTR